MKSPLLLAFFLTFAAAASGPTLQELVRIAVMDLTKYYHEEYALRNFSLELVDYNKEDDSYTLEIIVGSTECRVEEATPEDYDNCKFAVEEYPFSKCTVKLLNFGTQGYRLRSASCSAM
ncbi:uncharacterized protein LOC129221646 [Uloborus diversus]|uniref:uncharacterized protein LOC129221646 n=1 Tax=Uloborus diversus TaxID=327109 RepID=UPI00240A84A3|nr:uncharacterized protein LOC129221646 [Uloborus diversus]